jgi:hypothetical protein
LSGIRRRPTWNEPRWLSETYREGPLIGYDRTFVEVQADREGQVPGMISGDAMDELSSECRAVSSSCECPSRIAMVRSDIWWPWGSAGFGPDDDVGDLSDLSYEFVDEVAAAHPGWHFEC